MLKIHKGLKKKKKDKKNKHKEEELFNEEELEKYRKEHSSKAPAEDSSEKPETSNSEQSDEWQKFKALTAGVDTILQKTQEDLDRIKSTSFFQRKAPPSEVERQKKEERRQEEEFNREREEEQALVERQEREEAQLKSESEDESEEVDDNIFDTSFVDAVASGELKLAYIPDSPEKEDDFDPFDTSYADKFIASNPKKRYLNLGCAVEVLSGKGVSDKNVLPSVFEKKTPRRRVKPVDLLLTSFDEGDQSAENVICEKTPVDSPVKTLLDEDPLFAKDDDILSVAPISAPASTPVNPALLDTPSAKKEKLDFSEFEVNELHALISASSGTVEKQRSSESTDDEFAQLAAESLARKSSSALPTPNDPLKVDQSFVREPIKSFDAVTPTEFIAVNPLQPAVAEEKEIDPFDTSIVDRIILPGKQEIKLLEKELLSDVKVPSQKPAIDDIDDSDFDPRAGEAPVKAIRPQELIIKHRKESQEVISPSKKPDFLKIEEVDVEATKPLTPLTNNCEAFDENYDPFDTSGVSGAPGKSELKLIEKEFIHQTEEPKEEYDFDPRKYEVLAKPDCSAASITHTILNKYACNPETQLAAQVEPAIDILTGKEETPFEISHTPVEPEKFVESPEFSYTDPFDTSIADNIQPGKTELKLLESELFSEN